MKPQLIHITEKISNLVFNSAGTYVVFFNNIEGNIACKITAQDVKLYMFGLYDMKNKEHFKIHTEQIHEAGKSFSELYILSVADDSSALQFTGTIRIEKSAQKSHAYQKNQNLILSKDAFVDSRPILEILADDVFCTHGSTTGPLPDDQLNYLIMRGIGEYEAKNLLIEGFKKQVYNRINQLGIKL